MNNDILIENTDLEFIYYFMLKMISMKIPYIIFLAEPPYMLMMSNRIIYECPEEQCSKGSNENDIQKKIGFYDLVGFKVFQTSENTSEKSPVYLHSQLDNGDALIITKCRNFENNGMDPPKKAKRQWVGCVSIRFCIKD